VQNWKNSFFVAFLELQMVNVTKVHNYRHVITQSSKGYTECVF
jgi:hypothetical protein